jgi:hypothetical protein
MISYSSQILQSVGTPKDAISQRIAYNKNA